MAMSMKLSTSSITSLRAQPLRASRTSRRVAPVFASSEPTEQAPEQPTGPSTIFYGGKSYTEEEFKSAVAAGPLSAAPAETMGGSTEAVSFGDLMAFSGAPEIINGRLAMMAVIAAIFAELSSGESVLRQLADEPTGILLFAITFSAASLIPLQYGNKKEAFGPFTPNAEMINGRFAMLGFASLLVIEAIRGSALF